MEGTVDVDGMLERMTVQQFDEWEQYDEIQPIDHQTDMLGLMAWLLSNYMAQDQLDVDSFMPWMKKKKQKVGTSAGKAYIKQRGLKLK